MTDSHRNQALSGPLTSVEEPTPAQVAVLLRTRAEFRVRSVDGRAWIDPYGGAQVPFSGDFEAAAAAWLLQQRPWRRNDAVIPPQSLAEVLLWRWEHWARAMAMDASAVWGRVFLNDGRWLNPFSGRPVPGISRNNGQLTGETLRAMAEVLRDCHEAQDGLPLDPAYLAAKARELDAAARRSTDPPTREVPLTPAVGRDPEHERLRQRNATPQGPEALRVVSGYRIIGTLGMGGMSTVYRAVQQSMEREVALKVLDRDGRPEPQDIERFLREARAAGRINHPNVITCYDVGVHHGQTLYMALELMTGGDAGMLAERHGGRMPESLALRILRDAARGLGAIHAAGLVHRDVKPANLFIAADGVCKLGDLGLVRDTSDKFRTLIGIAVGTPAYMSPEQASGAKDLDIRSDIYALGASVFAILTGRPPHQANSVVDLLELVRRSPAPDVRGLRPDISTATAELLSRMMAKEREARFQRPLDLVDAVEQVRADLGGRNTTGPMPAVIEMQPGDRRLASGGMRAASIRNGGFVTTIQLGQEVLCLAVAGGGLSPEDLANRVESRLRLMVSASRAGRPAQGGASAAITRALLAEGLSAVAALVDPERHTAVVACTPTARGVYIDLRDARLVTDLLLVSGTIDLKPGAVLLLTAGTQGRPFALWGTALARAEGGPEAVAAALSLLPDGPASLVLGSDAV